MSSFTGRSRGMLLPALAVLLLIAGAFSAHAHSYTLGALEIGHPWSRATPPGATVGVGYLKVKNTGSEEDKLIAVEGVVSPKIEMHESREENGVAKMREIDGVVIPAGTEVVFAPGGLHLMLTGLTKPLVEKTRVPVTLVFERAGRVEVELAVEAIGAPAKDEHKHH